MKKNLFSIALLVLSFAGAYGQSGSCVTVNAAFANTIAVTAGLTGTVNPNDGFDQDMSTEAVIATGTFTGGQIPFVIYNFNRPTNPGDSVIVYYSGLGFAFGFANLGFQPYSGLGSATGPGGSTVGSGFSTQFTFTAIPETRVAIPLGAAAQSVLITFPGLSFGQLGEASIYEVTVVPGPPIVSTNQTICLGATPAAISGSYLTSAGNTTAVSIYPPSATYPTVAAGSVTALATNTNAVSGSATTNTVTYQPPALTQTTTYYVSEAQSGCGVVGGGDPATGAPNSPSGDAGYSPSVLVPITITVNNPTSTISKGSCPNGNGNANVKLNATAATGGTSTYSYSWAASGGGSIGSGGTTRTPTVTTPGTYNLTITDAIGCVSTETIILTGATCGATVLPITLSSFGVGLSGGNPLLTWTTASEANSSYFEIESSSNGSSFTDIGSVPAAGNSTSALNYSFTDKTATGTVVYYRIKEVDIDGNTTYSDIIPVTLSGVATGLKIYPNPVTNQVNVAYYVPASTNIVYAITDMAGKTLKTEAHNGMGITTQALDVSGLAKGTYIISVSANGATTTSKFTKL